MNQTRLCPNCGQPTDPTLAVCSNCHTPLTGYGGQVGQQENFERRLASQVKALETRPPVVVAMTIFSVLFALLWPLRSIVVSFANRPHLNADTTNYLSAAFGSIGPIFTCIAMLPIAALLFGLAYFTWTQRGWTWTADLVALGMAAVVACFQGRGLPTILIVGAAIGIAICWFQPRVKAWYGL